MTKVDKRTRDEREYLARIKSRQAEAERKRLAKEREREKKRLQKQEQRLRKLEDKRLKALERIEVKRVKIEKRVRKLSKSHKRRKTIKGFGRGSGWGI